MRIRDWIYPSVEGEHVRPPAPEPPNVPLDKEVAKEMLHRLADAVADEADRTKAIDGKLMAICSVAPLCVTLLLAIVTFITSKDPFNFTAVSVISVVVLTSYITAQFLFAVLAAVEGLRRRNFLAPTAESLWACRPHESVEDYLRRACHDLASRLHENRETTNEKVSHMAAAHQAVTNAMFGLLFGILVLSVIVIVEFIRGGTAAP